MLIRRTPFSHACVSPSPAPAAALLVNSCVIAIRSILSKFVTGDELGKFFIIHVRNIAFVLEVHVLTLDTFRLKKIPLYLLLP